MILFNAISAVNEIVGFNNLLKPDIEKPRLNVLISFPYIRGQVSDLIKARHIPDNRQNGQRDDQDNRQIGQLFLDAGTFTINVKATSIDPLPRVRFTEYVQYVKLYGQYFDHIAAYDQDFFDPDLNMHHLIRMEKMLPAELREKIIPATHAQNKEALTEFKDLVSLGYKYIAIGSTPPLKMPMWNSIKAFIREKKQTGVEIKTHTFGQMSFKHLKDRRPYSADSSAFAKVAGQETMLFWNRDKMDEVRLMDFSDPEQTRKDKRAEWTHIHDEYLSGHFQSCTKNSLIANTTQRHLVNFYAIVEMEKYFTGLPEQSQ